MILTVGGVYVYLSVMELPVHIDLSLCDVASQVGDGMGDVWVRGTKVGRILSFRVARQQHLPSFGIVKMGICVMEPFRPSTRPARYRNIEWCHRHASHHGTSI